MVSTLIDGGATLDENTVQAAFGIAVGLCEAADRDGGELDEAMPRLLHHVLDADFRMLQSRGRVTTNVTCLQVRASHRPDDLPPKCRHPTNDLPPMRDHQRDVPPAGGGGAEDAGRG